MGTKGASGITKVLIGSVTARVIKESLLPILSIPENAKFSPLKNIVFASDLHENQNDSLVNPLKKIAERFNSEITLLNILKSNEISKGKVNRQIAKLKGLKYLNNLNTSWSFIESNNLSSTIEQFCENNRADLLTVIARHNNFFGRLLHDSISQRLVFNSKLPILTLDDSSINEERSIRDNTIIKTDIEIPKNKGVYNGKVRDVFSVGNDLLVMIVTDRISCFDVVLPKGIPYKGQVINQLATYFLEQTEDIVPNWLIKNIDPNVSVGYRCQPFQIEMIVRGYLAGHAWREYSHGKRTLCGVKLPEGLRENDKLPKPIITPTTKAEIGHDEDISKEEILKQKLVSKEDYELLEKYALALFERGTKIAAENGLILVDTKYEFGKYKDNEIYLIDEIHTPDSSRYFFTKGYDERQEVGEKQKQLSKEFLREWLIENGFQGKEGQLIPEMSDDFVNSVSERYIELFEILTDTPFKRADVSNISHRIGNNIHQFLLFNQLPTK
ncbi:MAG: phosphoribosylaminoimidazolesuccinocarboxamide synthase [Flavobacteriales bacterium]|nr:MAG: phosphoribosylaminoimidazolesuccinocarboxamide synthase [Flavobacteriales bacterium]